MSDIGVGEMEQVMIQYETRNEIPTAQLERVVKAALDDQWKRLEFGKMIDRVCCAYHLSVSQARVCVDGALCLLSSEHVLHVVGRSVSAFRAPAHRRDHCSKAEAAGQ